MIQSIQCIERNLSPDISGYKDSELEICASLYPKGLTFALVTAGKKTPMAVVRYGISLQEKNYLDCILEIKDSENLLAPNLRYSKKTFSVNQFKSTVIPESFYNHQHAREYMQRLFHLNGKECITQEAERKTQSIILTAFNPTYLKAAQCLFQQENDLNFQSPYARIIAEIFMLSQYRRRYAFHALLNVRNQEFDLCVKNDNGILFLNTFPYPDFDNLLYYLLYTFNSLRIDIGQIDLHLCGLARKKNLLKRLEPHVNTLSHLSSPSEIVCPKGIDYDEKFICL